MTFRPIAIPMFCDIFLSVARASRTSSTTPRTRSLSSAASAVSSATSVPPPIATPTLAAASAGASLMPSPIIATGPDPSKLAITASLSSGSSSDRTSRFKPSAMAFAVRRLSPVSMIDRNPRSFSRAMAAAASARTSSRKAISPRQHFASWTTTTILPVASIASIFLNSSSDTTSSSRA